MTPPKKLDLLIDEFIETDIRAWVEDKQREAEQLEWDDAPFSPESGDQYSVR